MNFQIVVTTYKEGKELTTFKRNHHSLMHANFDAKDISEKLKKRSNIDDWKVVIIDKDGDEYSEISPTVGDKCNSMFVGAMMMEMAIYNKALKEMAHDVVLDFIEDLKNGQIKEE